MATTRKKKKSSASSSPRRRRKSNTAGGKKFAVYAVILGIGAAAIVFYNQYPGLISDLSSHSPHTTIAKKSPAKKSFVEPDYQFYTLLPQGNDNTTATTSKQAAAAITTATPVKPTAVVTVATTPSITMATTNPAATVTPKTTPVVKAPVVTATPTHRYELQLAAFRHYEDADELKAKLVLQGYPTTINSANVNGTVWYRLWIGPYTTVQEAKATQTKLAQTHLVNNTRVVVQ